MLHCWRQIGSRVSSTRLRQALAVQQHMVEPPPTSVNCSSWSQLTPSWSRARATTPLMAVLCPASSSRAWQPLTRSDSPKGIRPRAHLSVTCKHIVHQAPQKKIKQLLRLALQAKHAHTDTGIPGRQCCNEQGQTYTSAHHILCSTAPASFLSQLPTLQLPPMGSPLSSSSVSLS